MNKNVIKELKQKIKGQIYNYPIGVLAENVETDESHQFVTSKEMENFEELNNNLGTCKLIAEGSGANTKYYIQNGADTASKKLLGSIELKWFYKFTGNNGTCTYETKITDLNPNKKYHFIVQPLTTVETKPYVSSISNGGTYTEILSAGRWGGKIFRIEKATFADFTTVLTVDNSGVDTFYCEIT